jgi:oxaloacetate decarboxylase gamma subunit
MRRFVLTIFEMLEQSMILTVLGMLVVFVFLWIMIILVNLTGKAIHNMGLDKDLKESPVSSRAGTPPQVIAAIGAAVKEHRKNEE